MFNGFELSEITKYLCYQDFINFRKVSKSIYERTKNEYILRRCIATLSINKIQKCWKNNKNKKYSFKWADTIGLSLFSNVCIDIGGRNIGYNYPSQSYWTTLYRKHTNFAMESFEPNQRKKYLKNYIIEPSKKQNKLKKLDYKQFKK